MKSVCSGTVFARLVRAGFAFGGIGLLAVTASAGTDTYYVNDPLATTVAKADAAGKIAQIEADAFGAPQTGAVKEDSRFTGKPYDEDMGAYVFPFRNYRPDEARWMTQDPSGFPNGINNWAYSPNPESQIDNLGLFFSGTPYDGYVGDEVLWDAYKVYTYDDLPLTEEALDRADGSLPYSPVWLLSSGQSQLVKNSYLYQNTVYGAIQNLLNNDIAGGDSGFITIASIPHYHFNSSNDEDLAYAIGGINFTLSGNVTLDGSDWSFDGTVVFGKNWTFSTHNPATDPHLYNRVGARLEAAGYIKPYFLTGSFSDSWTGHLE